MARHGSFRALIALAVVSLACSLGGGASGTEPSTTSESTSGPPSLEASPSPTEIPPGEWLELEQPPPEGILDALKARVESGDWTYEEGLIQSLKIFTGEMEPGQAFPEVPSELEGTGLVMEAISYLQTGSDEQARQEIERLLNIVAPDPEKLLPFSRKIDSPSSRRGSAGLAQANLQLPCSTLWTDGFPDVPGMVCFQYTEEQFQGLKLRVFGPESPQQIWGSQSGYLGAALQAVKDSLSSFGGLFVGGAAGKLGNVDVVFTLINTPKADALAVTPWEYAGGTGCRIIIYPDSIVDNENKKSADDDFAVFQQTMAHEMFHCFTAWNYPAHWSAGFNGAYEVLDWWLEGAAEYFSNVVYPKTNDEWFRTTAWQVNSAQTSVVNMSYDNFGFFQYLGNSLGNNGLLSLLATMPTSGDEAAQAGKLAAQPNMETIFHDYALAFVDGKILDSAGAGVYLPTKPAYVLPENRLNITQADSLNLAAPPFVLMRYGFTFQNDRAYATNPVPSGSSGAAAARLKDVVGAWGALPPEVKATCSPLKYYYVLTRTGSLTGPMYEITLGISVKSDLGCDKCLVGTWDINIDSFAEYAEAPFADTPGMYQFDSAGGLWRYHFRADSTMLAEFDFFYGYHINQKNEPLGNDITIDSLMTIVGTGEGTYTSDGLSNLTFAVDSNSVVFSQEMYMNGEKMTEGPIDMSAGYGSATGASAVYSCDEEEGELLLNTAPETGLPPILYNRVSEP
ncbi:MAG TPA: hypothetical protein VFI11_06725 [Anaerolineales bacterium]|nr:hypothetical protein [Anaerolineales bacterium]